MEEAVISESAVLMPLAHEDRGSGDPLILLHGLTFDRTSWRPIIERLGDGVRTVAVDLPGHGETGGSARSVWDVAADVHSLARELSIDRPIVVGHSMSGAIASIYGAWYPTLGVVNIDQPLDVRPFANLVRQLWPALNGPGFTSTFQTFQRSMGLENVPQPLRSQILEAQAVRPDVVLGYWDELRRADADQIQTRIEKELSQISCPYLAVSGRQLASAERHYMAAHVRELQITEWPGSGHFVHLVDAGRFAERLRAFLAFCMSPSPAIM
jgi:pimeloyl-ACP methyl ester carboxylesterase